MGLIRPNDEYQRLKRFKRARIKEKELRHEMQRKYGVRRNALPVFFTGGKRKATIPRGITKQNLAERTGLFYKDSPQSYSYLRATLIKGVSIKVLATGVANKLNGKLPKEHLTLNFIQD